MLPIVNYIDDFYTESSQQRAQLLEPSWRMSYDGFRGTYASDTLSKWKEFEGFEWRSKVFVRLTKQKVVAGYSNVVDIYLANDRLPFSVLPTPVPESSPGQQLSPDVAQERMRNMNKRMEDIFIEGNAVETSRDSWLENALYGQTWINSPYFKEIERISFQLGIPNADPTTVYNQAQLDRFGRFEPVINKAFIPVLRNPSIWNMFWDMEVNNPQEGIGIIHREHYSEGRLRRLLLNPEFNKKAINKILDTAPNQLQPHGVSSLNSGSTTDGTEGPYQESLTARYRPFVLKEFNGIVPKELMTGDNAENAGEDMGFKFDMSAFPDIQKLDGKQYIEVKCITASHNGGIDGQVIWGPRINSMPGQVRPYHLAQWEKVPHEPGGVGIAENVRDSQMIVNGAWRAWLDAKAYASNPMAVFAEELLSPGQDTSIYPGKEWAIEGVNLDNVDVRKFVSFFQPVDASSGLLDGVAAAMKFADMESGLPKILEGELSQGNPETAFAVSQAVQAANKALGQVIANYDAGITKPLVTNLYHWLMVSSTDQSIKGDYTLQALGFKSFTDRVTRKNDALLGLQLAMSDEMLRMLTDIPALYTELFEISNLDRFLLPEKEVNANVAKLQDQLTAPTTDESVGDENERALRAV